MISVHIVPVIEMNFKNENGYWWLKLDFILFLEGSCDIPALNSDPNYNRIIPNDTSVDFGTDVTIECRYGTRFRNLSLYCGESGVATYTLLGDNLTCPGKE